MAIATTLQKEAKVVGHKFTSQCGFDRNGSHNAGHYVCACGWEGSLSDQEIANVYRDAARFRYLQSVPVTYAQAFFWNHTSKKDRVKAIDKAMHSAEAPTT